MRKKILICLLAALYCTSVLAGCGNTAEEVMDENIYVEAACPEAGSLVLHNEFVGTVSPEEAVYVVPMVSAEVLGVSASVGDSVTAGDVLCQMDSEAAELQLESAQASYHTAQASANQSLGGAQAMQDYQTQSGINSLEKQVTNMNKDLTDSKNDYTDADNDLNAVSAWEDDAEESYKDAATDYNTAKALSEKFSDFKGSNTGRDYAGCTTVGEAATLASAKAAEAEKMIAENMKKLEDDSSVSGSGALTEEEKAACNAAIEAGKNQLIGAKTAQGIQKAVKEAGFSGNDLTSTGLMVLSNKMTMAQAEYQNAATQVATLEAKKDGYDGAVEQMEDGLDTLQDNLQTAKDTAGIQESQVKPQTKEVLEAQLGAADVGVKSAQMQLDMYTLTAPISGVIEAVNVSEHGFASAGNAAFVISNRNTMTVNFTVSEGIRNTFSAGQKITVARGESVYDGVITEIGAMVDAQTGLFMIKASVEAADGSLLTGSSVKITADTYREDNTLILPYDAVYYDNGQAYVYTVENNKAVKKSVETGIFDEQSIAVLSGLTGDDQVIVSWAANLREGADIVVETPETEAAE